MIPKAAFKVVPLMDFGSRLKKKPEISFRGLEANYEGRETGEN